jgi:hypothetical protein
LASVVKVGSVKKVSDSTPNSTSMAASAASSPPTVPSDMPSMARAPVLAGASEEGGRAESERIGGLR